MLTEKELGFLEAQLNAEKTLIEKCKAYAQVVFDAELKVKFNDFANKHSTHYDALLDMLS